MKPTFTRTGTRSIHVRGPFDFDKLQRAKNEAWGPDAIAILVFPPESELETGPLMHLWRVEPGTVPQYSRPETMPERYPGAPEIGIFKEATK